MRRPFPSRIALAAFALALAAPASAGDFDALDSGANAPFPGLAAADLAAAAPTAAGGPLVDDGPAAPVAFGARLTTERLDRMHGGDGNLSLTTNRADVQGTVEGNTATNVLGGGNVITDGSFGNATGISTVIQNSGSNVLIQNSTIVNVQFVPTP